MVAEPPAGRRPRRDVDGIVLLDKPAGLSSNRALQRVKGIFNARKAGHCGSLDPLATGMLPICLGEATKLSGYLLGANKEYRVRLAFGLATTTGDEEGATAARGVEEVSLPDLEVALAAFRGGSLQTPPMYSALKVRGQPLYRLARAGQEFDRQPRAITISDLRVETYHPHSPVLRVRCSKGTYVRTLVEDIARQAGTVAHVLALRRLSVAPFPEGGMVSFDELERATSGPPGALERYLVQADEALSCLPDVRLGVAEMLRVTQGQPVGPYGAPDPQGGGLVRLYGPDGDFLGIGAQAPDGRILPRRMRRVPTPNQAPGA